MMLLLLLCIGCGYIFILNGVAASCADGTQPDGRGVYVAKTGDFVSCKYLIRLYPEDKDIGIYVSREDYCRKSTTECCTTCAEVFRCEESTLGIYLAEMYFDCKYLLKYYTEDKHIGIYANRKEICEMSTTKCCHACKIVKAEPPTTISLTTENVIEQTPTTESPQRVTEQKELVDTCENHCIWIADGKFGRCSWLLDPANHIYPDRLYYCNMHFATGCQRTCHQILSERQDDLVEMITENANTKPAARADIKDECTDNCLWLGVGYLGQCSWLLDPARDIYVLRKELCISDYAPGCTKTCNTVLKEDSPNNVEHSEYGNEDLTIVLKSVVKDGLRNLYAENDTQVDISYMAGIYQSNTAVKITNISLVGLLVFILILV